MKRKVAKVGPSTLMISLPSKWCRENAIKRGEELNVDVDQNKNLVVGRGQPAPKSKEIQVDLSKFPHSPRHLVAAAYKTGYDKVIAKYSTERERKDVENILTYTCLGFAILDETKNTMVIKDITEIHEKEFEQVLRKIFFLTSEIAKNTLIFSKEGTESQLYELISMRRTFNKYADFCRRIINKHLAVNSPYPSYVFSLIKSLGVLTGNYRNLCFILSGRGPFWKDHYHLQPSRLKRKHLPMKPEYLQLLEKINQQVYSLPRLFYHLNAEEIDLFQQRNSLLMDKVWKMIEYTKENDNALELSFFLMILKDIRDMRWDLLDLSLG